MRLLYIQYIFIIGTYTCRLSLKSKLSLGKLHVYIYLICFKYCKLSNTGICNWGYLITEKGGGTRALRAGVLSPGPYWEGLLRTSVHRPLQCVCKYSHQQMMMEVKVISLYCTRSLVYCMHLYIYRKISFGKMNQDKMSLSK